MKSLKTTMMRQPNHQAVGSNLIRIEKAEIERKVVWVISKIRTSNFKMVKN